MQIFVRTSKGNGSFGDLGVDGRILKLILKEIDTRVYILLFFLRIMTTDGP
jgi:hypothetical protein